VSRSKPSGLATEMGDVYSFHFVPRLAHAGHYSGWAHPGRVPARNTEHQQGRGAKITAAQVAAGGSWIVTDVEPGTRDNETQRKEHGRARDCTVCKAERSYKSGQLDAGQALKAAGWDRATQYEKGLLVETLGISEVPAGLAADLEAKQEPPRPIVQQWPRQAEITPEVAALADGLIARWTARPKEPAREYEMEAG
jgi:hypothetical protein